MTVKSFVPVLCAISQLESPRRLCRNMYISASVGADLKREKDTSKRFSNTRTMSSSGSTILVLSSSQTEFLASLD